MSGLNKVMLIGRAGKDAETIVGASGSSVCKFSMATNEYYNEKDETTWHNVVMFGKVAERAQKMVTKGRLLYVEGRIKTGEYTTAGGEKRKTFDIIGWAFEMLDMKPNGSTISSDSSSAPKETSNSSVNRPAPASYRKPPVQETFENVSDDIPF